MIRTTALIDRCTPSTIRLSHLAAELATNVATASMIGSHCALYPCTSKILKPKRRLESPSHAKMTDAELKKSASIDPREPHIPYMRHQRRLSLPSLLV